MDECYLHGLEVNLQLPSAHVGVLPLVCFSSFNNLISILHITLMMTCYGILCWIHGIPCFENSPFGKKSPKMFRGIKKGVGFQMLVITIQNQTFVFVLPFETM